MTFTIYKRAYTDDRESIFEASIEQDKYSDTFTAMVCIIDGSRAYPIYRNTFGTIANAKRAIARQAKINGLTRV